MYFKNKLFRTAALMTALVCSVFVQSCEDPVPNDYEPVNFIEAYLKVGDPIQNIQVFRTQSVTDTFRIENAILRDVQVVVTANGNEYPLSFRETEDGGEYYFPDSSVVVLPNTRYEVDFVFADGATAFGTTLTPGEFAWTAPPRDELQYPIDSLKLPSPDSIAVAWTESTVDAYVISLQCLDTLNYGAYLNPPTEELNRRIYRSWEEDAPRYDEVTRSAYLIDNDSPVGWFAFKWFGKYLVEVQAVDANMDKWYKFTHWGSNPQYSELSGSIEGDAIGALCSYSAISKEIFLVKNQP